VVAVLVLIGITVNSVVNIIGPLAAKLPFPNGAWNPKNCFRLLVLRIIKWSPALTSLTSLV
jgi:hypothetical protein